MAFLHLQFTSIFSAQTLPTPHILHGSLTGIIAPLNIPLILSGNFGEFRGSHFHTGLDIKTQGKEGFPVLAVADGIVSRIKVSPWGYGQAVYLLHKDGSTTVYAHLSRFSSSIESWLVGRQYKTRSFSIDTRPTADIRVNSGDTIGWSGNSGSSGGPHLHFEVRDQYQHPVNPLQWDFAISDTRAPIIGDLWVIPVDSTGIETRKEVVKASSNDTTFIQTGIFHLCIEAKDKLDGAPNVCGIYRLEVEVDGLLYSSCSIDTLDFAVNRDMNAHAYFPEWKSNRTQIHRFTPLPGDRLSIYRDLPSSHLSMKMGGIKSITVRCYDAHGNISTKNFVLKGKDVQTEKKEIPSLSIDSNNHISVSKLVSPSSRTELNVDGLSAVWSENSFYSPEIATITVLGPLDIEVGPTDAPLSKAFELKFTCPEKDEFLCDMWVAERFDGRNKSKGVVVCSYVDGKLAFSSRNMGHYRFSIDTIPPNVLPKYSSTPLVKNGDLIFHVDDKLSGVSKVEGTINGEWVLFRWDPKKKTAIYKATDVRHEKSVRQTISFRAWDGVGQVSEWVGNVVWP